MRTTEYRYTVEGQLEELVCRNGDIEEVTRWEYGTELNEDGSGIARADLVRAKVYPDRGRVEYGYDRLSEVVRMADQNGTVHEYGYDKVGRLRADRVTEVGEGIDESVRAIRVNYLLRGEVEKVTSYDDPDATEPENVVNEVLYAYNGFGQEINEWQSHDGPADTGTTPGIAYGYENGADNTVRLGAAVFPKGNGVEYTYTSVLDDLFDRVSNIGPSGLTPDVAYERLGLGTIVRTAYGGGLEMTAIKLGSEAPGDAGDLYNGLDRFGRLQDARWMTTAGNTDIERVEYGFDRVGNRQWRRNLISGAEPWDEFYRYDGLYQIQELTRGKLNVNRSAINGVPAWQEQWRYDLMGNWLGYDTAINGEPSLEQERSYNAANELLMINGSSAHVEHDAAGNMTRVPKPADWNEGYDLKWDAWNRLVQITAQETEVIIAKYAYDGLTRRITKETGFTTTPVLRHFYYSMNWRVVEERAGEPALAERQFLWGVNHIDDLINREQFNPEGVPTTKQWALNDGKNVTAIAEGTEIEERFAYEAFGVPIVLTPSFVPTGGESAIGWETLFCGYRWDEESGLYQVRYRYFHPELGRWVSRDPLIDAERTSIPNLYLAVTNSPSNSTDPDGRMSKKGCDMLVKQFSSDPLIRRLNAELRKRKCPVPSPVCKCCDEKWSGYFNPWWRYRVVICHNNIGTESPSEVLYTYRHELIHARNTCYRVPDSSCEEAICEEMMAYAGSGECSRPGVPDFKTCVIEGAISSARARCKRGY